VITKKRPTLGCRTLFEGKLPFEGGLFADDEFTRDGLAILQGEAHGVGALAEVGEIHCALGAEVLFHGNLLAQAVEDDHFADSLLALDVELANSGVRIEVDLGVLYAIDADEGDDGNPAGVFALDVVGGIVEGGLEGYVDVALDIGDDEGVGSGGLAIAIGPFVGRTTCASRIEFCGLASVKMPFTIDGADNGRIADIE